MIKKVFMVPFLYSRRTLQVRRLTAVFLELRLKVRWRFTTLIFMGMHIILKNRPICRQRDYFIRGGRAGMKFTFISRSKPTKAWKRMSCCQMVVSWTVSSILSLYILGWTPLNFPYILPFLRMYSTEHSSSSVHQIEHNTIQYSVPLPEVLSSDSCWLLPPSEACTTPSHTLKWILDHLPYSNSTL